MQFPVHSSLASLTYVMRLINSVILNFSMLYIILYLVIISLGLIGNFIFCFIIKKCPSLHRTQHFFFLAISVMDIFVCILAIPFAIDSQVKPNVCCHSNSHPSIT